MADESASTQQSNVQSREGTPADVMVSWTTADGVTHTAPASEAPQDVLEDLGAYQEGGPLDPDAPPPVEPPAAERLPAPEQEPPPAA